MPSPYTIVQREGRSVVASTPVTTMSQSKPYVIATPFVLLRPGEVVVAAPNAPDVRLMIAIVVPAPQAIARSPLLFL